MKKLYNKIAPVVSKIAFVCLIISLVALVGSKLYLNHQNSQEVIDQWAVFYGLWAEMISTVTSIVFAVIYVIFDIVNLWYKYIRKMVVSLKRNPSMIPLVMMFITFVYYSLNLTDVSDTTAKIYGKGMGLCQFCMMLFNMLCMLCMLNAFPRRKKANIPMVVLMFVMFGILVYCDIHYLNGIAAALNRTESPIKLTETTAYIAKAFNMLATYQTMIIVTAVLVVLMPVYSRLLKKVKTSVDVEDNGAMGEFEIND